LAEVAGLGDLAEVKRHSIQVEAFDRTIATLTLPELQSLLEAAGE
jgi:hypothetical protein